MTREVLDLACLRIDYVRGIGDMMVDYLLVTHVNQGPEVDGGDRHQRETPERYKFDHPVRDQGRGKSLKYDK